MPLVANTSLPAFTDLRKEGETVIPLDVAVHQDIRELHIALEQANFAFARQRKTLPSD